MEKQTQKPRPEEIQRLIRNLGNDYGAIRQRARASLVAMGKNAIDFLAELIVFPQHIYRWEAVKALGEMEEPETIPYLIEALSDDKSDVRWLAAEGLIRLGNRVIRPLLEALLKEDGSVFLLESAHHVFFDLKEKGAIPPGFPIEELLQALKRFDSWESVKEISERALESLTE